MGVRDKLRVQQRSAGVHRSDGVLRPGSTAEQRSHRARWLLIAGAIAGVCMLTAGIAIAVFSPFGGPAQPSGDGAGSALQSAIPAPSGHATTGGHALTGQSVPTMPPGVASDGVAKTALRFPKRLTKQVSRWEAGPGGKALGQVTAQMGYALQTAGAGLYPSMKQACANLASDIQAAQAGPPIPDAAMQRLYGQALARLSLGAANCRSAISVSIDDESTDIHVNKALLQQSRTEMGAGSRALYKATAEVRVT
jgi:hypothetical protein